MLIVEQRTYSVRRLEIFETFASNGGHVTLIASHVEKCGGAIPLPSRFRRPWLKILLEELLYLCRILLFTFNMTLKISV